MVSVGFNAAARLVFIFNISFESLIKIAESKTVNLKNNDSIRTSNELGAGNPKSALFSAWTATFVSFVISLAEALAVIASRDYISYIFTSEADVAKAVSDLCPFLAVTIILNGIQPVLSGIYIQ